MNAYKRIVLLHVVNLSLGKWLEFTSVGKEALFSSDPSISTPTMLPNSVHSPSLHSAGCIKKEMTLKSLSV